MLPTDARIQRLLYEIVHFDEEPKAPDDEAMRRFVLNGLPLTAGPVDV